MKQIAILGSIIIAASLSRFIPHPMNFAPLGAMALFGAAYFSNKQLGFLVPFLAWFASDLVLNNVFYNQYFADFALFTPGAFWIYGSMAAIFAIGAGLLRKITLPRLFVGSLSASVVFFVLSNFGVWMAGMGYPMTLAGLEACYIAALPFFVNTLLGDLFYSLVLFGLYEALLASHLVPSRPRP